MHNNTTGQRVISAVQLSVNYRDNQVLDNLDLTITGGSIVGLVGKNGAGKSTLIRSLLGLKKINGGKAEIFGQPAGHFTKDCKAKLGYVAQHPVFPDWLSVQSYLNFRSNAYPGWDNDWVDAHLLDWSVPSIRRIGDLTTGQKQRLAIISEMAFRPQVLLLDEPVAGLDFASRMEFLRETITLCADFNTTILFSTHLFSDIHQVCSHIAWLYNGRIALYAELDEVRERYQLITVALNDKQKNQEVEMPTSLVYRKLSQNTLTLLTDRPEPSWISQLREKHFQVTSEPASIENLSLIQ